MSDSVHEDELVKKGYYILELERLKVELHSQIADLSEAKTLAKIGNLNSGSNIKVKSLAPPTFSEIMELSKKTV